MPRDALLDEWFADTYGFTPAEVAEMPLEAYQWYPVIRRAHNEAAAMRQRQAQRMRG
jgi:hypothetical protein